MTELKTLKDLPTKEFRRITTSDEERDFISKKLLIAEAIKWIKEYSKDGEIPSGEVAAVLMNFFNLNEEDLK